jgi:LacI family transcriptional regulator
MAKALTSRDVAQAAGVSQSTVSLVLAGKWPGRVSAATAEAVQAAAERLGYRPNHAARSLRLGRAGTVLLIVPTLSGPFFGEVYAGAARVAAERDLSVVVYLNRDGAERTGNPFGVAHQAIDGVLASSMAVDVLAEFGPVPLPVVMLDSDPGDSVPTVTFDMDGAFRAITRHLLDLGHTRLGHLASSVDTWTFRARREAIDREAIDREAADGQEAEAVSLPLREFTTMDVPSARAAARRLLDRKDRPTALICDDDMLAAGAYKAAKDLGLAIPGDLSVTGSDDILLAEALEPELTTVRLPAEELGARGMRALLALLDGERPPSVSLPAELVRRDSTAPPGVTAG